MAPLFQTNLVTVRFGHDALLVIGPGGGERHAYDIQRGKRVPLWPHGVLEIEGTDDDRVIATDAAGRALVSTDGGGRWTDVSAKLGAPVVRLRGEAKDVWFELLNEENEKS